MSVIERCFRPKIEVRHKGGITTTVVETPWYGGLKRLERACDRIGNDVHEMVTIIPWKKLLKNRTFQNIAGILVVIAAARNQEPGSLPAQGISTTEILPESQPPVETPVIPEKTAVEQQFSYKIQPGDTLFSLAQRFGVTVEALMEANGIENRDLIHAGDDLIIPGRSTSETIKEDKFRRVIGNPETSGITKKDIAFLQWLNAKQLWWEDWNGHRQIILIPIDPYRYAKTVEEAGGPKWNVILGLGATETGYFPGSLWEPHTRSYAGAVGPMQILEENFKYFAPYPDGNPVDPKYNFLTGGNLASYLGLNTSLSEDEWVNIFLGGGPTGRVWNYHRTQAIKSYRIAKALEGQKAQFESEYQEKID